MAIAAPIPVFASEALTSRRVFDSLAIAIGYPDLFNIFGTVANQTGRTLESIGIVMGIYLVISLVISALVNQLNRRFGRKEKR